MALKKLAAYLTLAVAAFVSVFPFYFMFTSATNSNKAILNMPPRAWFGGFLAQNFESLSAKINIGRVAFNSLFVSLSYTVLAVALFSLAGYAFSQYEFKGKKPLFAFVMVTMMLPPQVLYIPMFQMMTTMSLDNTYASVIFPLLANAFGIFLIHQNLQGFPASLVESARIDGCNELSIFARIVLPNLKPALGALGIYMFIYIWNQFMWPLIILGTKDMYTFPVALSVLDGNPNKKDYGMLMLAASLATLPIMAIFLTLQKQFVMGVMSGAVKE